MVVPFLNIPIISVVLLLLAGILIGHLIWYRDRSDDEAMVFGLRAENNELQTALHEHKQAYVALEEDLEDSRKEWDQLKSVNKQLELAHQATDQDLGELNSEIGRLQQLKDQAFHDLDQERQQRRAMQDALQQAEQNSNRVNELTEQLQAQVEAFQAKRGQTDETLTAKLAEQEEREARLRTQLESLVRDRDELRDQLAAREVTLSELKQSVAERKHVLLELAEQQETASRLQAELRAREEDLSSLRQDRDEYHRQLDDERRSREKLEGQVTQVNHLVRQRDEALAQLEELTREVTDLRQQLDEKSLGHNQAALQLEQRVKDLTAQSAILTREHDAVAAMLVDERTRLSKMEADNHRLSLALADAEQQSDRVTSDLRTQLETQTSEIDTLRRELEETAALLSRERHQREHLQSALHERKVQIEQLERESFELRQSIETMTTRNGVLSTESSELAALRGEHASVKRMLESTTDTLNELREMHELTISQRQELEVRIDDQSVQNALLAQQVEHLAVERDECVTELDRLQHAYETALAGRLDLETTTDHLQDEVRALQSRLAESTEVARSMAEVKQRLEKVVAQRDEMVESRAADGLERDELRKQVEMQSRSLSSLNQQNHQLRQKAVQVDELRRTQTELNAELEETNEQLAHMAGERDEYATVTKELESRAARLEARAKANEETIRNLRRERAAVSSHARQAMPHAVPFTMQSVAENSGGRMRRDEVLGMVYTQPPKRKDDLKRITGIAQVLEKKLNAFGVYTYRQIMQWDVVAVEEFSKLLSFRDRIDRDDWIRQARDLHEETYGRAA